MDKKEAFKKIIIESQRIDISSVQRDLTLPLEAKNIISLYGPRRCGKTYLFYQTIKGLIKRKVSSEQIIYVNFEDERILPFRREDWEILIDAYFELYPDNSEKQIYIFLDEVQEAPMWEKFVRRLSEKGKYRIFVTGSSSKLFSREIATSLRGRTTSYFLMPFSFGEFLRYENFKVNKHIEHSSSRHKVKKLFQEYLRFGGFPEVFDRDRLLKMKTLGEYFELTFYKDIVERYKIRNFTLLKDLMRYLLTNFASLFSLTAYYNFLKSQGQKIGKDTLFDYLSCLEDVNFVKLTSIFDFSLKKQTVNPKKVYCIDTGLISAVSFQFSENKGKYLENLVYLELLRRGQKVYYFKDSKGREVDFLVTEKDKPKQLIQVCSNLESPAVKKREINPLLNAANRFNIKECLILTEDQKSKIVKEKIHIKILPVWQWMLELSKE